MLQKAFTSMSVLFLASCSSQKSLGPDPMVLLDARLSSLEAQVQETKSYQERLAARMDGMTDSVRPAVAPKPSTPRGKMRKRANLPITKLTPEGAGQGNEEEGGAREETELVVDSRHEGLHLYRQGLQLAKDRKFDEAIDKFRRFLKENPDHVYSDRAQYQIAKAHYDNKEYGLVIVAAQLLETKYPFSFRIPEVSYHRAMALLSMGQTPQATDALKEIMKRFPKEEVAETASRKLAELSVSRRSHENVPLLPEAGT